MAQEEKYGFRNSAFSAWHRVPSLSRFVSYQDAMEMAMIDTDGAPWMEYANGTKRVLLLLETAIDNGQPYKATSVMRDLAEQADIPAFLVMIRLSDHPNPAYPKERDIAEFLYRRVWPDPYPGLKSASPHQWCAVMKGMREWCTRQTGSYRRFDSTRQRFLQSCEEWLKKKATLPDVQIEVDSTISALQQLVALYGAVK